MVCSHSFVGVAPGEAPKAEATELAPEAVGAGPPDSDYNPGSLNRSPRRAFLDDKCFWWNFRAEALGHTREDRATLFVLDQSPQRRAGPVEESLHPRAFAACVVVLANRLACRGVERHGWRCAFGDGEVPALMASLQVPIQPQFHAQPLMAHAGLHILPSDLVALARERKRIIVADHARLDVTQDRG